MTQALLQLQPLQVVVMPLLLPQLPPQVPSIMRAAPVLSALVVPSMLLWDLPLQLYMMLCLFKADLLVAMTLSLSPVQLHPHSNFCRRYPAYLAGHRVALIVPNLLLCLFLQVAMMATLDTQVLLPLLLPQAQVLFHCPVQSNVQHPEPMCAKS